MLNFTTIVNFVGAIFLDSSFTVLTWSFNLWGFIFQKDLRVEKGPAWSCIDFSDAQQKLRVTMGLIAGVL